MTRLLGLLTLLLVGCVSESPGGSADLPYEGPTTAFIGATLWDGTGAPPLENATLVVRGGRIVGVGAVTPPEGADVVDLSGRWVIPGLINAHGHVSGRWAGSAEGERARVEGDLLLYARYGVTTVNSLGGEGEAAVALRDAQATDALARARVFVAGPVLTASDPVTAAQVVDENAALGVDWIKFRVDDNLGSTSKMPEAVATAIIERAHALGLRVATHLFYLADAKFLLRAGTDLVAHSVRDASVDQELIQLLDAESVCYVPTLTRELSTYVYAGRPAFFDDPFFAEFADATEVARLSQPEFQRRMAESPSAAAYETAMGVAQANLAELADAGVAIAFGTDSGPAARFPGYFEHLELELMVDAGLTAQQALRSATGVAAECLDLVDVGTLEVGRWADFLVLAGDPLAAIVNTRQLEEVYVAGNQVR